MLEENIDKIKSQSLLEKLKILDYKYEKLEKANQFNIFSLLVNSSDEVNLHSKFIAEILSPNGAHNLQGKFLKAFLEHLGIHNFEIEGASVKPEYKDIDVFIGNYQAKQAIILENKIYAADQYRQLERYNNIIKDEGYNSIYIFYLTLDGQEASADSIGELPKEKIENISYQYDIIEWIGRCIEISALIPTVRETLKQYQNLVKELTNQSIMKEQVRDLMELLGQNDYAVHAKAIADNWKHIRWHAEYNFWYKLEHELKQQGFLINDAQKWSEQYLTRVIHYQKSRDFWYGLMFEFYRNEEYSFRLFIERGDENLYYGVCLYKLENRIENFSELELRYRKAISTICAGVNDAWWLGWNYIEPQINFELFNTEAARLVSDEYRDKFIDNLVVEITEFVKSCKGLLEAAE